MCVEVDEKSAVVGGGGKVEWFIANGFDRVEEVGAQENIINALGSSDVCVRFW